MVTAQNTGYDQFTKIVSISKKSPAYSEFIKSIGEEPKISYHTKTYKNQDWTYLSFYTKGLELLLVNEKIHQIFFHNKKNPKFASFSGNLPYEHYWSMTKSNVHKKMGEPICDGGGGEFLGEKVLYWDKYDFTKFSVHITYNERNEVYEVCLTEVKCSK
jgi:hypothetical protein